MRKVERQYSWLLEWLKGNKLRPSKKVWLVLLVERNRGEASAEIFVARLVTVAEAIGEMIVKQDRAKYLTKKKATLGGRSMAEMLKTEKGLKEVLDELNSAETEAFG